MRGPLTDAGLTYAEIRRVFRFCFWLVFVFAIVIIVVVVLKALVLLLLSQGSCFGSSQGGSCL